jgi:hypothetical protein
MFASNGAVPGRVVKRKTEADLCMEHVFMELGFEFIAEYLFGEPLGRKWRFDYVIEGDRPKRIGIPASRVAIEIDGGSYTNGRHTRGIGFRRDLEKFTEAAILGWSILRFTPQQVLDGTAKEVIKRWLESHR